MRWVLPEYFQDVLPPEADKLEHLRRQLLDAFRAHGYQMVVPPLVEYLESLLTGAGQDLRLRTFKSVDQLSGRTLGVRADMTPQVARIDAHLLNRRGVTRLCYCGAVAHTMPATLTASREPMQLGAEIYGHAGIEADIEVIRLLNEVLRIAQVPTSRIDLSHVGLFRALMARAGLDDEAERAIFDLLQAKDVPGLNEMLGDCEEPVRSALMALPRLYGGVEVLAAARTSLPDWPEVRAALDALEAIAQALPGLPISVDLADLRGYHYHSGVVFAAYGGNAAGALALGGRYDAVGQAFGRGRPATGFSLDLRELVRGLPASDLPGAILAPADASSDLAAAVADLRGRGEIVMEALPGHDGTWREAGCDRQLVRQGDRWTVVPLVGE
ncbi:ATP phosphoribosyltransferase regulatory subunit [Nitrogeniibacter mangrovi]|uniref:ATP phosphoribosyltransferase regulatory subunit n=2 Tax=Nitrogeniibacter mangrovi TaxID=2016596 RepID=A0A6C1B562_9RHOO|nr:ATP phosphoribosyltransferase regulatory subunit [Nitrogeniibacter mangrovi]QID18573.1 ATP phosphoribosyltransferase regulatory subunit [Nitrogeniibacter mangrovi]